MLPRHRVHIHIVVKKQKPQLIIISWGFVILVPGAGIEPARPQWPQDFKSCVSTNSTTRAHYYEKESIDRKKADNSAFYN